MTEGGRTHAGSRPHPAEGPPAILWIGRTAPPPALRDPVREIAGLPGARIVCLPVAALDRAALAELAPLVALSTLTWPGGDVLEAGLALQGLGFARPYRALCPALPDGAMIEREVRLHCPDLDFAVVEVPGPTLP